MKKTLALFICSLSICSLAAQTYVVKDTATRRLFKDIANGMYSSGNWNFYYTSQPNPKPYYGGFPTIGGGNNSTYCPTCFIDDSTIDGAMFYKFTSRALYINKLKGAISLNNKNITTLEPFLFFAWGDSDAHYSFYSDINNQYFETIFSFTCDSNTITDLSPLPLSSYRFFIFSCRKNNLTGPVPNIYYTSPYYNQPPTFYSGCTLYPLGTIPKRDFSYNHFTSAQAINYLGSVFTINQMQDYSHNDISSFDFLSNIVGNCCDSRCSFDVSYNNLTSIPTPIPAIFNQGSNHFTANFSHNPGITSANIYFKTGGGGYYDLDLSYCNISNCTIDAQNANFSSSPIYLNSINLSHNNFGNYLGQQPRLFFRKTYLIIPKLDLSYNRIKNFIFNDTIYPFAPGNVPYMDDVKIGELDISNNQITDIIGDIKSSGLDTLRLNGNFLNCLPTIPDGIKLISFDTGKIKCIPNTGSFFINTPGARVYPVCNPTNNVNHCFGYPTVLGRAFIDSNKNSIKDLNEQWANNFEVNLTCNNKTYKTYTDANGYYNVSARDTGVFKVYVSAANWYVAKPDTLKGIFRQFDTTAHLNTFFAIQSPIIQFDSVKAYTVLYGKTKAGFNCIALTNFRNYSTGNITATVSLRFDSSKMNYLSNSSGAVFNGVNEINKTFTTGFNGSGAIISYLQTKPTATIGDTVWFYTIVSYNGNDNIDSFYSIVKSSFDPNDKNATPFFTTIQVANGSYIDYTVHFQNTGNDTAVNVVIADTLSSLLQANSFQLMGSSHNCKTTINGNKVYFEFTNIQLPDSNINQLGSNGFVSFRVKPVSNAAVGTIIPNTASIYFDYNKPVLTNVANTKIIIPAVVTPLTITGYQLRLTNDKNVSNEWQTANEVNVSHYNIERSENARDFIVIGKIKANNNAENDYTFRDDKLPATSKSLTLYYRITGVDNDGRKTYSQVKSVTVNDKQQTVNIYPNPTKDLVNIESKEEIKKIVVIDYLGKIVKQMNNATEHQTLNTKQFNKGLYIVQVITAKGNVLNEKLVVE